MSSPARSRLARPAAPCSHPSPPRPSPSSPARRPSSAYTTQPAGATAGSTFGTQPVVTVEDAAGNTVTSGADSTINITAAIQTGTGSLQGTTAKAAVAGVATFTNLRIDTSGAKTLRASGTLTGPGAVTVDSSSFTVGAGAATQLVYTTQPSGATAGSVFGTQPVVTVEDAFGNTVTSGADSTINVTAAIQTGTGSLQGTITKTAVAGVATFTNLRIDTSGAKTLRASGTLAGPGAVTVDSSSFTVGAGAATQLVYTTQPAGATAGSAFGTQPVVTVEDAFGNTVTTGADSTINITAAIQTGTGSLQGTTTKAAVAGVATFTNLRIDTQRRKDPARFRHPRRPRRRHRRLVQLHRQPSRRPASSSTRRSRPRRRPVQRSGRSRSCRSRTPSATSSPPAPTRRSTSR